MLAGAQLKRGNTMLLPNRLKKTYYMLFVILAMALVGCTSQTSNKLALEGLVTAADQAYFDQVLVAPGQPLPGFSRVFIEPSQASFSEHWLRSNRGEYTQRDLDRLTSQYASLLDKALRSAMEKDSRYQLVETPQEAEVIVRAQLQSLNIYAPDLSRHGISDYYIHEAGNATLNLLLVDATTGSTLAQFIDHRETSSNPSMRKERTNRVTNARYFSRLMDRWTNNLMTYLGDQKSA